MAYSVGAALTVNDTKRFAGHSPASLAASPSSRAGLIAASQGSSRLYQKMSSDPGRNSPDDPFADSTSITHEFVGPFADKAEHVHTAEAQSKGCISLAQSAEGLYHEPSVEIIGAELYDNES